MAMSSGAAEGEPMMDINTTPLIDVMLVLLIMFIITIPVQTHAVKLDLPQSNVNPPPNQIDPVKNEVFVNTQNQVLWNGSPVTSVYPSTTCRLMLEIRPAGKRRRKGCWPR